MRGPTPPMALAILVAAIAPGCGLVIDASPSDVILRADAAVRLDGAGSCRGACDGGDSRDGRDASGLRQDSGLDDDDAGDDDASGPDAGGSPPTCTITAPIDGNARDYDTDFTFVATAGDAEDGALSGPSVVWRSDRVVTPLGAGLSITTRLPPGEHSIRCTATDSGGRTGTDSIVVTSRSPIATIVHPSEGETRASSTAVPFSGAGRDFEDGTLGGESLDWTSSRDGRIGVGTTFSARLSAGTHVITLTATDADGNTGTESVTLTVTP